MEFGPIAVFLVSLVPLPLASFLNSQRWMLQPHIILVVGLVVLSLLVLVPYMAIRRMKNPDFILKVLPLYLFSSVVDLIIALEADGYLSEFMSFYIKEGEPYLFTTYGTMICYWDGVVHYLIGVWILLCIATGRSYRKIGLFLSGSYINSLLVLIPGSLIGNIGFKWAILLNVPYIFVPLWVTFKLFKSRSSETKPPVQQTSSCILSRPVDLFFLAYFLFATYMDLFRGFMALGCQAELVTEYLYDHEPYIMHPTAYPKIQMLVNMAYYIPYYACAIYGLFNPGQPWLQDWALFFAGASAQGQFAHIGGAVHPRTEAEYQVPPRSHSQTVFWILNIILLVVPQLFALKMNCESSADVKKQSEKAQ